MAIPLRVTQAASHLQRIQRKAHLGREPGGEDSAALRGCFGQVLTPSANLNGSQHLER